MSTIYARARAEAMCPVEPATSSPGEQFDEVVRRYRGRVMLAAYRITQNVDDARDVTQHVFIQLFRKQPMFSARRSIERWLYVVTRNQALGVHRRRQRDTAASASVDAVTTLGLEDTVLQNERSRHVRAMIALLPRADRDVIELRFLQSFSETEIALGLGVPVSRVKRDVERAMRRLRYEMLRTGTADDLP